MHCLCEGSWCYTADIGSSCVVCASCSVYINKTTARPRLLLIASAFELWLAIGRNIPRTSGIVAQVVILNCATTSFVDPYSFVAILVDTIATQRGIAPGRDLHSGVGVAEDVVVLQRPLAILIDVDATLLAIMDAVTA